MSKESVIKFLEDFKQDSALLDNMKGLNKGKTKVDMVKYLTEEANRMGYEFTALEMEEQLLSGPLSALSELVETKTQGSREKPPSKHKQMGNPNTRKFDNLCDDPSTNNPTNGFQSNASDPQSKKTALEKVLAKVKEGKLYELPGRIWD